MTSSEPTFEAAPINPSPVLLPNFGAEEDLNWRLLLAHPLYRRLALLWQSLFSRQSTIKGVSASECAILADELLDASPVFDWLPNGHAGVAWLMTEAAAQSLKRLGCDIWGASPAIVRRMHDKAFIRSVAKNEGLDPPSISALPVVFEPDELGDANTVRSRIHEAVQRWPEWAQRTWTLKPRMGSSGRGRLPGFGPNDPLQALEGALPRFIDRGGFVLEPFVTRVADLSAQFVIRAPSRIELLGVLEQRLSTSGSYTGHRGIFHEETVGTGSEHEPAFVRDARKVVLAASKEGLLGPCGVDGFTFRREGIIELRSCVELNARFTVGTVVIGLLHRLLRRQLASLANSSFEFFFHLSPIDEERFAKDLLVPLTLEAGQASSSLSVRPVT